MDNHRVSKIYQSSEEEFREVVANSATCADVRVYYKLSAGCHIYVKRRMEELNLTFGKRRGLRPCSRDREDVIKDLLVKGSTVPSGNLRKLLIKFKLLPYECQECALLPAWRDAPLSLHLDHINGDRYDNQLSNLRFLCPNCHSQTPNFGGKY